MVTFLKNLLHERIIHYHPMAPAITAFSLTHHYAHGLQVLPPSALLTTTPMGFRYYRLQRYLLLPSWASGITTFSLTYYYPPMGFRYYHLQPYNPTELLFIPTLYIRVVYYLFNCGTTYVCRVGHDHFICG